jgi:hypothetical protein
MLGTMTDITARKQNEARCDVVERKGSAPRRSITGQEQPAGHLKSSSTCNPARSRINAPWNSSRASIASVPWPSFTSDCTSQKNLASIDFDEYVKSLCSYLIRSQPSMRAAGDHHWQDQPSYQCRDSVRLIINERVSNALKYAFKSGTKARLVGMELTRTRRPF